MGFYNKMHVVARRVIAGNGYAALSLPRDLDGSRIEEVTHADAETEKLLVQLREREIGTEVCLYFEHGDLGTVLSKLGIFVGTLDAPVGRINAVACCSAVEAAAAMGASGMAWAGVAVAAMLEAADDFGLSREVLAVAGVHRVSIRTIDEAVFD